MPVCVRVLLRDIKSCDYTITFITSLLLICIKELPGKFVAISTRTRSRWRTSHTRLVSSFNNGASPASKSISPLERIRRRYYFPFTPSAHFILTWRNRRLHTPVRVLSQSLALHQKSPRRTCPPTMQPYGSPLLRAPPGGDEVLVLWSTDYRSALTHYRLA